MADPSESLRRASVRLYPTRTSELKCRTYNVREMISFMISFVPP
jgi:hypothetical protein